MRNKFRRGFIAVIGWVIANWLARKRHPEVLGRILRRHERNKLSTFDSIPIHSTAIYTYKEAAALSKCSYVTIWRAVANGKLKAATIGNHPRILGSYLLEWIESGGETGRSKATM
jgi:excisionase family DNA binding protein